MPGYFKAHDLRGLCASTIGPAVLAFERKTRVETVLVVSFDVNGFRIKLRAWSKNGEHKVAIIFGHKLYPPTSYSIALRRGSDLFDFRLACAVAPQRRHDIRARLETICRPREG